jgi:uncharacterized protein
VKLVTARQNQTRFILVFSALFIAVCAPILAQGSPERHLKAVHELFQVMEVEKSVNDSLNATASMLAAQTEDPAKAKPKMEKFILATVGFKAIELDMAKMYQNYFAETEVQELIKFYKTPAGKKFAQIQPLLFKEGAQIAQAKLLAKQEELQKIIESVNESK